METVNLFTLATAQSRWLEARQAAVAGNIANANTAGYTTMDVDSFEKVLDRSGVTLARTQGGHLGAGIGDDGMSVKPQESDNPLLPSGNSVVLENELLKSGEIRRAFELNTAVVKAFHRMIMLSSKG